MRLRHYKKVACFTYAAFVIGSVASAATLTKVDIYPPNNTGGSPVPGSYTTGAGGAFTITSDGTGFFPNMDFAQDINNTGDILTFAYETVTGDFDKRVKITGITADNPIDNWTRGALMVRTAVTNHYCISFQMVAGNPQGANQVGFCGRALDGQNYTWWSRNLGGVTNALPNQWLRLSRVGDQFTAYVSTNGSAWALVGQRYQVLPATLFVGPYAASGTLGTQATVQFASYGDTPFTDAIAPTLISAGTLDKKVVGVRFSEQVQSATAKVIANYQITQPSGGTITITNAKMGISGDAVYLAVTGLTNDAFSVKVIGGIKDVAGNTITPNQTVAARALNWNHGDIGYIQNPNSRPTVGDDPGTVGQAVMVSSDENPEIEIVGGGSNQWNPGDFIHYVWRTAPLSGNFDVTVAVSRYDRPANTAGWGNSGIMLRASDYLPGNDPTTGNPYIYTKNGTKVKHVSNSTYLEASAPGRGAIPLWRTADLGGYGNGNAGFGYGTLIGGVKGYFADLRAVDASGTLDPQSAPGTARYLRIKRVGTQYTFYASWNRTDWALVDGPINLPDIPDQLLLGFSTMGDTGGGDPPFGGYGGNGHQIDPADPYNPVNAGGVVQNDSNYEVQRIKVFPNGVTDPLPAALTKIDLRPQDESVTPPNALAGSWSSTGTYSFDMTGGGTGLWRNLGGNKDGTMGGDELTYAYQTITGDFDKQVKITKLSNVLYMSDGSALDTNSLSMVPPPIDSWARAGLMVRSSTNSYDQCLKIFAGNPAGGNSVIVAGRAIDAQDYIAYSPNLAGVSNALPNQYLRMKRVGNSFCCYVSKDGVVWSLVTQRYIEMTNTVLFGPYCAASLNPADATGNPDALMSLAVASFASYQDVNIGDLAAPTLMSAGTLDKKTIGVKFSEQVSSATATVTANYKLSQGTVTAAKMGIGGDSVYLTVSGLTTNTFTVAVTNVTDTYGNKIVGQPVVQGKVTGLLATDIGYIQNLNARPTVGDDPYRTIQAVATSSDDAAEVEVVGGGSNAWNPGDYLGYIYSPTKLSGDFDVSVKVSRYDHAGRGGYANSGLMMRADLYNAGEEGQNAGTQVPMFANVTYFNLRDGPGRGAIPLWRTDVHGGYGNGNAGFGWGTLINGIKGYYPGINPTDSVGTPDPLSSSTEAHWLRVKRIGDVFESYCSWDGIVWMGVDTNTVTLPSQLFLGYSTMVDSGGAAAPNSAYGGNGHTIDPTDPLNPANAGGNVENESNFAVTKIRMYNTASIGAISISKAGAITYSGTLVSSTSLKGPWTVVVGQGSPYQVTPTGTQMFYRVLP